MKHSFVRNENVEIIKCHFEHTPGVRAQESVAISLMSGNSQMNCAPFLLPSSNGGKKSIPCKSLKLLFIIFSTSFILAKQITTLNLLFPFFRSRSFYLDYIVHKFVEHVLYIHFLLWDQLKQ